MKRIFLSIASCSALCGSLNGASYFTDFDNVLFPYGADLAGHDGWMISGASDSNGPSIITNSPFPSPVSGLQGAGIGFQEITGTSVYLYRNSGEFLVGNPAGYTQFQVAMTIQDSTPTYPNRDVFGFSFRGPSNEDILTIRGTPTAQTATPQFSLETNQFSWTSDYSVLDNPNIGSLNEGQWTTINLTFTPSGINDVAFSLKFQGVEAASGILTGAATAQIATFGAIWEPLNPLDPGANQMFFDDISLVPEPSSSLLICLAGLGFISRRRRP